MDESPAQALRNKKESSMRVAIELVRDGQAKACVSAGNTGALMATARFVLKCYRELIDLLFVPLYQVRMGILMF